MKGILFAGLIALLAMAPRTAAAVEAGETAAAGPEEAEATGADAERPPQRRLPRRCHLPCAGRRRGRRSPRRRRVVDAEGPSESLEAACRELAAAQSGRASDAQAAAEAVQVARLEEAVAASRR